MCLAIPGTIKKIDGKKITVSYPRCERTVYAGGEHVELGDYVLVQMGIVIKVISPEEFIKLDKVWGEN